MPSRWFPDCAQAARFQGSQALSLPGDTPPENLASLVGDPIDLERNKANWNDILRLVTTIRSGQVRLSTLLAKLSAFPRHNGLPLALRALGRINRSICLPQWWQNPEMRRNATAGLNKSESQNTLARALFFNRLGELRDRTFESQFYRASGLNLLFNAIVYWNTLYLQPAFAQLNREGIARPSQTDHPARVATHQAQWRLHLDLDGKPRSQAATARNIHPRSVITIRSQKSDRFNTFVS